MAERGAVPENLEKVVEFERPKYIMTIRLPLIDDTPVFELKKYVLVGMHTDMMGEFSRILRQIKPRIREKLLIQARVMPNRRIWQNLRSDPVYQFFISRRLYRRDMDARRDVLSLLVPKDLKLSNKQIREYSKHIFTPESLAKNHGFRAGWYKANFLAKRRPTSLTSFLGAVNEFEIGTNKLNPGIFKMVGFKFIKGFEDSQGSVVKSGVAHLSGRMLEKIARIVEV